MVVRNNTDGSCPSQKEAILSSYACTGQSLLLWEKKSVSGYTGEIASLCWLEDDSLREVSLACKVQLREVS